MAAERESVGSGMQAKKPYLWGEEVVMEWPWRFVVRARDAAPGPWMLKAPVVVRERMEVVIFWVEEKVESRSVFHLGRDQPGGSTAPES